jgi:acyl carrier protein
MTTADVQSLERELVDWVVQWNEDESDVEVTADTELSATGLLDSMALVGLVSYLEDRMDSAFDFGSYDPHGGVTVRTLIAHCAR